MPDTLFKMTVNGRERLDDYIGAASTIAHHGRFRGGHAICHEKSQNGQSATLEVTMPDDHAIAWFEQTVRLWPGVVKFDRCKPKLG